MAELENSGSTSVPQGSTPEETLSIGLSIDEAIEETFTFEQTHGSTRDLQKTLMAVAFLLDAESNYGNEDVNGAIATGLAQIVKNCARNLREYYQSKDPSGRFENGEFVPVDGQNAVAIPGRER